MKTDFRINFSAEFRLEAAQLVFDPDQSVHKDALQRISG